METIQRRTTTHKLVLGNKAIWEAAAKHLAKIWQSMSQRAKEKYFSNRIQKQMFNYLRKQSKLALKQSQQQLFSKRYAFYYSFMTVNTDMSKQSYIYYSLYILFNSKVQIANISGNENGILVLYTGHDFLCVTDRRILQYTYIFLPDARNACSHRTIHLHEMLLITSKSD